MKKRIFSLFLAVCMVVGLLSVTAVAGDDDYQYVVAGTDSLLDVLWKGSPSDSPHIMTKRADGKYELVVPSKGAATAVQFKVVANAGDGTQAWYGDANGNNISIDISGPGDVTIVFDPVTNEIQVFGDCVSTYIPSVDAIYAVGNGDEAWLNGFSWAVDAEENRFTETATGVYELTMENVDAFDNYQFKYAANGSWMYNWGGDITSPVAIYNGDNIVLNVTEDHSTIRLVLDLRNFSFVTLQGARYAVYINDVLITPCSNHTLTYITANPPSATADGNVEYWYCASCGKCYADSDGQQEISADSVIIPGPVTLSVAFKITDSMGGNVAPGDAVFTLAPIGQQPSGYEKLTISGNVATVHGTETFNGELIFQGNLEELFTCFGDGLFFCQKNAGEDDWTYDSTVWALIIEEESSGDSLGGSGYVLKIYPTESVEKDGETAYLIDFEQGSVNAMTFNNLFTRNSHSHSYSQKFDKENHWDECTCKDKQNIAPHQFGAWTTTTPATLSAPGEQRRDCQVCDYYETKGIPQLSEPEPTDPEPTNPEPTNPEPTNPEPTNPEPTNPEPTNPEPTNPEPTNPEPTNPEPTDPEPTNPTAPSLPLDPDDPTQPGGNEPGNTPNGGNDNATTGAPDDDTALPTEGSDDDASGTTAEPADRPSGDDAPKTGDPSVAILLVLAMLSAAALVWGKRKFYRV